jgi:hypothetical protein
MLTACPICSLLKRSMCEVLDYMYFLRAFTELEAVEQVLGCVNTCGLGRCLGRLSLGRPGRFRVEYSGRQYTDLLPLNFWSLSASGTNGALLSLDVLVSMIRSALMCRPEPMHTELSSPAHHYHPCSALSGN